MRAAFRRLIVRADAWLTAYLDRRTCATLYAFEAQSASPDRIDGVHRIGDVNLYSCCICCLDYKYFGVECEEHHRTPCDRGICAQNWAPELKARGRRLASRRADQ